MNLKDFDRSVIRQRNEELLREVQIRRLEKRLRAGHKRGPQRTHADLDRKGVMALLRKAARIALSSDHCVGRVKRSA
jgi:hypothetical protein